MRNRIKELRKQRGWSMAELGKRSGTGATTINKLEKGEMRLSDFWMDRLAKAFQVKAHEIIEIDLPSVPIVVNSAAEMNLWQSSTLWPEDAWYSVFVPTLASLFDRKLFGVEVRGHSMDRLFKAGTVLVCAIASDSDDIVEGRFYVTNRTRPDRLIEQAVWELERDADGEPWLWPRSSNPMYQTPIRLADAGRIVGYVMWSIQPHP